MYNRWPQKIIGWGSMEDKGVSDMTDICNTFSDKDNFLRRLTSDLFQVLTKMISL